MDYYIDLTFLLLLVTKIFLTDGLELFCGKEQSATVQYIRSMDSPHKNGTILSSNRYPRSYDSDVRCIIYLIGAPNERVSMKFVEYFDVKAVPPRCLHDYVDIYIRVKDVDANLLDAPLQGRFCGKDTDNLPELIISMYNILVIGFYTDSSDNAKGFKIEYSFFNDDIYRIGTPASPNVCGLSVSNMTTGLILSPTHPGTYPDNIFCYYKLYGQRGQRIRMTFHDIDIYSGGDHCPFDFIKIYDGSTNNDPVIATICGIHQELILYSTTENLTIEFSTKSGRKMPSLGEVIPKMRGFNATFFISSDFINTVYMTEGDHILGTECDRIIHSTGESSGVIQSPNFPHPYPSNVVCQYFIDGKIDRQNLEKVELVVELLDIGQNKSVAGTCEHGSLKAYTEGQKIFEEEEADHELCGTFNDTHRTFLMETTNPRLILVFNSTPSALVPPTTEMGGVEDRQLVNTGRHLGFRAKYLFITDFAIQGTPATTESKCHFEYRTEGGVHGTFNSPRHPSYYPKNTVCTYDFYGHPDEHVRITFENFQVEDGGGINCTRDSVKVFKKVYQKLSSEVQVGQYCGNKLPGPIDEDTSYLKVVLKSVPSKGDGKGEGQGFRAKYEFIKRLPQDKQCVHNITSSVGGKIESPNYPHKYTTNKSCDWIIRARSTHYQIMIVFNVFNLEGNPSDKMGCGNAVLKIYTQEDSGMPTNAYCGENATLLNSVIYSKSDYMRIKFISSSKATGERGFRLPWTEIVHKDKLHGKCNGFLCKISGHCISASLKCNRMNNCGENDTSDEPLDCGTAYREHGALNVILGIVLSLIAVIVIIVCVIHRRRTSSRQEKKEIEVRFMTRSDSALLYDQNTSTICNKPESEIVGIVNGGQGSLLRLKTEKVSII